MYTAKQRQRWAAESAFQKALAHGALFGSKRLDQNALFNHVVRSERQDPKNFSNPQPENPMPSSNNNSLGCLAAIEFLIHCRAYSFKRADNFYSPFIQSLIPQLEAAGLIEPVKASALDWVRPKGSVIPGLYQTTDRGAKHLNALCLLPFPEAESAPGLSHQPCVAIERIVRRENALAALFRELTEIEEKRDARAAELRAVVPEKVWRASPFTGEYVLPLRRPFLKDDPEYQALVHRCNGLHNAIRAIRSSSIPTP